LKIGILKMRKRSWGERGNGYILYLPVAHVDALVSNKKTACPRAMLK